MLRSWLILASISLVITSCTPRQSDTSHQSVNAVRITAAQPGLVSSEVTLGNGIACRPYQDPNSVTPLSYSAHDIGRPGVATLSASQLAMLRRIQHYVHSSTLRFLVEKSYRGFVLDGFVVFDATDGPCADFAPGYQVLSSPTLLYYEPGESIKGAFTTIPESVGPSPGPWL